MEMFILIDEAYSPLLVPMSDLAIIERIQKVEKKGYGKDAKIYPKEDPVSFEIVMGSQVKRTEADTKELLTEKLASSSKEASEQRLKAYELDKKVKELTAKVETLMGACPKPALEEKKSE